MALPDISTLTLDELRELIGNANAAYYAKEQESKTEAEERRAAIGAAITDLTALLGPAGAPKGLGSIRAASAYTETEMAAAPGKALDLAYIALERLGQITLDLAHVVANQEQ